MPYVPVTIGLKFNIRIRDLTARDVLVVTCQKCEKGYRVAPHVLHDRYHELYSIMSVEKDFRCHTCGTRGNMHWYVERAVNPTFPRAV